MYAERIPFSMANAEPDSLSAHLHALYKRTGLSYETLAHAGGYRAGSSVQKFLDNKSDFDAVHPKTASKLAKALYGKGKPPIGVADLARLVGAKVDSADPQSEVSIAKMLRLEVAPPVMPLSYVAEADAGRLPVVGSAHASFWMPSAPSLDGAEEWLTAPFISTKPLPGQYVLKIIGPSINREAADGTYAICRQYGGSLDAVPNGKFVHAERERDGEYEWTLKKARWGPGGLSLWPDSDHKDHQEPLSCDGQQGRVTIKGIVIAWHRPA